MGDWDAPTAQSSTSGWGDDGSGWDAGSSSKSTATDWNAGTPNDAWNDDPKSVLEDVTNTPRQPHTPRLPRRNGVTGEREFGTVKTWRDKGFGFIGPEDGTADIFCHIKDTESREGLTVGSKVSYRYEEGGKGGSAKEVRVEEAVATAEDVRERENGTVKRWNADKGFGFIGRASGGDDLFFHKRDAGGNDLKEGQYVSFVYEDGAKGGVAKQVREEEGGAVEDERERETGTVKRWSAEKGFGFIERSSGGDDLFVHKKDVGGNNLSEGHFVSFVYEEGGKGGAAKNVREEEGGAPVEAVQEEAEGEREFGKVKNITEEKGFCFIGRCAGGDDLFALKKDFISVEPTTGLTVSFIVTSGEKGDAAKMIREEESIPEFVLSDEGREFGTVKSWIEEKGFGFIAPRKGGEDCHVHIKQCNDLTMQKGMCVSYVFEEGDKGPSAKDVRQEHEERVLRVTAKKHYGVVEQYSDPPSRESTNGWGFIIPNNAPGYGKPKKYYFHMSNITTPDDEGGIEPKSSVSFIVIPAKKGVQAADVTIADPPKPEDEPIEEAIGGLNVVGEEEAVEEAVGSGPVEEDEGW